MRIAGSINYLIVATGLILTAPAWADSPPKDFLNLEACATVSNGLCTLGELVTNGMSGKRSWKKISETKWLLILDTVDKITDKPTRLTIQFEKSKDVYDRTVASATHGFTAGKDIRGNDITVDESPTALMSQLAVALTNKTGTKDPLVKKEQEAQANGQAAKLKALQKRKADLFQSLAGRYSKSPTDKPVLDISILPGNKVKFNSFTFQETGNCNGKEGCKDLSKSRREITVPEEIVSLISNEDESIPYDTFLGTLQNKVCPGDVKFGRLDGKIYAELTNCWDLSTLYKFSDKEVGDATSVEKKEQDSKLDSLKAAMEPIEGHYKHPDDGIGGEYIVEIESPGQIKLAYKRGACLFHNKVIPVSYVEHRKNFSGVFQESGCRVGFDISFVKNTKNYVLLVDSVQGDCKQFCGSSRENPTGLMGNFIKK